MDEVRKVDVVIDACRSCGGMWLDEGELDKLRAHVRASANECERDDDRRDSRDSHNKGGSSHDSHGTPKKKKSVFDLLEIFGEE